MMAQESERGERGRRTESEVVGRGGKNSTTITVMYKRCMYGLVLSYVESPQKSKLELISSSRHHSDNNTIIFTKRSKVRFRRHKRTS